MQFRLILFFFFTCWFSLSQAQFFDDFSDPEISSRYLGNVSHFNVNAQQQLQLNASVAGSSYISRQIDLKDSMVWEFYVRLDFDPSTSNRMRFWLCSSSDVLETGDGLYIEVGESLNNDALRLFRKIGNTRTGIASASAGKMAFTPAIASVRCIYNSEGNFILSADYSGSDRYAVEFSIPLDFSEFEEPLYFGPFCQYTDTRRSHFYFDDFRVDELKPDTIPPILLSFETLSSTEILLHFNEDVDPLSLDIEGSVVLNPTSGSLSLNVEQMNPRNVIVSFSNPLINTAFYDLTISNISDLAGNAIRDTSIRFQYLVFDTPESYDLIFSELMVRPNPPQGLPAQEYIELFNRSDKVLQLADFTILDGSVFRQIDDAPVLPGEFVILCSRNHLDLFRPYGKTAGMNSFPGLTDSGKKLVLFYQNQLMIDWVEYDDSWYGSSSKSGGGFSLELVNPLAPCLLKSNWLGSESPLGGTPGSINSIWKSETDTSRFILENVYPASDQSLTLKFDKKMDALSAVDINNYFVDGIDLEGVSWSDSNPTEVTVILDRDMTEGNIYEIEPALLRDCQFLLGQEANSGKFGKPQIPDPKDIVINEILFQPETGGSRFVELYNRGDKIIDLASLFLADFSGSSTAGSQINQKYILFPGEYVALSANPEYIRSRYYPPDDALILRYTVPTLSDRSGNVSLYCFDASERIMLDSVNYSRDFHYGLLSDRRGVSIERISPDRGSSDSNNWHSAASTSGYATPGYKNSQFRVSDAEPDTRISIPDPFFTPNDDGHRDFLEIHFNAGRSGFASNVRIFDAQGRLIRTISRQEILPESGTFIWDGLSESGQRAGMGIYVVLIELVHPDGEVIRFKSDCTLGGSFK